MISSVFGTMGFVTLKYENQWKFFYSGRKFYYFCFQHYVKLNLQKFTYISVFQLFASFINVSLNIVVFIAYSSVILKYLQFD